MSVKKIESLTKEQTAQIEVYAKRYMEIGLSTEPCDRARAEAALIAQHHYNKLPTPTIIWADSPFEGAKIAAQIATNKQNPTKKEIAEQTKLASFGSLEAYWVAFYAFTAEQLLVEKDNLIEIVNEIIKNCGTYWTFDDKVVVTEKPIAIHMKDGKLHNPNGLALEYKDGTGLFAIDGVTYPSLLDCAVQVATNKK